VSSAPGPLPIRGIPAETCRRLTWFCTDIDDTLTDHGMLPAGSYGALWDLSRAGMRVVPVTGRPAGWCDHIARMWPVRGVVGENGAFWYAYDRETRRMTRRFSVPPAELESGRRRLSAIAEKVLREVPGCAIAADQPFRISDFAIDFREDVPALPPEGVDAICRVLRGEGVQFKVSSIHVNFWLGGFDKLSCLKAFLEADAGEPWSAISGRVTFIGDSPNDEPLFEGVPEAIAVGNLRLHAGRITHFPRYITEGEGSAGFCEAAAAILGKRR
jgi:HAD superfamily hydrolase (TIGR01484 family)